ncbi:MAG TPA: BON domain-containing protein [Gemmatimonadaceae bacterium]
MPNRKQLGLVAGLGVGATLLLTDAGPNAKKHARAKMEKTPRTNHQLAARVAAELEDVEHGRGIQVFADNNRVTLRGFALRDEIDDVISAVQRVKGVRDIDNKLDVRESPGKVLALQS